MTKADLVEIVYEKIGGLSKKESQDIVEAIFETMKNCLKDGEKIKISGFGNFTLRDKRPRKGRNPQTGDDIQITARRVLTFRPSQILKTHINVEKPT
jgi:integration host factor subunit alpha